MSNLSKATVAKTALSHSNYPYEIPCHGMRMDFHRMDHVRIMDRCARVYRSLEMAEIWRVTGTVQLQYFRIFTRGAASRNRTIGRNRVLGRSRTSSSQIERSLVCSLEQNKKTKCTLL
jgi:hypothetical protein